MANIPELRPTGQGNSFFSFINDYCLEEASGNHINRTIHRLCTLMRKMYVKNAVVETLDPSYQEISREIGALNTRYGSGVEINSFKFTFLSEDLSDLAKIVDLPPESFLSSVILINCKNPSDNKWKSYVFSAIVTIPRIVNNTKFGTMPLLNNYLHIYKTFPCEVNISDSKAVKFDITGTFFCQQNSVTSVCAHASLCMTINNMNLPDVGMISSETINEILNIDHSDIKFGKDEKDLKGLTKEEIQKVLQGFGLTITWIDFFENPNIEYNEFIYRYIESQCPVLLVFSTSSNMEQHIVPVIGHTLNSDMWSPEAEPAYSVQDNRLNYKPASAWIDHFLIHDDNFGMYLCLPVEALKRVTLPKYDPAFRAIFAVAVIPDGVSTPAWEAEWASVLIVKGMLHNLKDHGTLLDDWSYRIILSDMMKPPRPTVVRTFLVKKDNYKRSLEYKDFDGRRFSEENKTELLRDLPERFWLSEITIPDLYTANKTKIIDVFYGCDHPNLTDNNQIYDRWIQVRLPEVLVKKGKETFPMDVKSHYPLLRFESDHEILDW